jgi:hypothetical protein
MKLSTTCVLVAVIAAEAHCRPTLSPPLLPFLSFWEACNPLFPWLIFCVIDSQFSSGRPSVVWPSHSSVASRSTAVVGWPDTRYGY